MAIFALNEHVPEISESAWVSESAQVIGQVRIDEQASVWPGAVLRADLAPITLGSGSNLQDNAVVHVDAGRPCTVGRNVTVGHGAILHGCTIEDGALIGMGAVVLNGAVIGRDAIVGAGALVAENKVIPERALVVGTPARLVRTLSDDEVEKLHEDNKHYQQQKERFRTGLRKVA